MGKASHGLPEFTAFGSGATQEGCISDTGISPGFIEFLKAEGRNGHADNYLTAMQWHLRYKHAKSTKTKRTYYRQHKGWGTTPERQAAKLKRTTDTMERTPLQLEEQSAQDFFPVAFKKTVTNKGHGISQHVWRYNDYWASRGQSSGLHVEQFAEAIHQLVKRLKRAFASTPKKARTEAMFQALQVITRVQRLRAKELAAAKEKERLK